MPDRLRFRIRKSEHVAATMQAFAASPAGHSSGYISRTWMEDARMSSASFHQDTGFFVRREELHSDIFSYIHISHFSSEQAYSADFSDPFSCWFFVKRKFLFL